MYEGITLPEPKTKILRKFLDQAKTPSESILFVIRKNENRNLLLAQSKIKDVKFVTPNEINVFDILKSDKVSSNFNDQILFVNFRKFYSDKYRKRGSENLRVIFIFFISFKGNYIYCEAFPPTTAT